VADGALRRPRASVELTEHPPGRRDAAEHPREAELVAELLEHGDRLVGDREQVFGSTSRAPTAAVEQRVPLEPLVAGGGGRRGEPVEQRFCARQLAYRVERQAQLADELEPRRLALGDERDGAVEQVDRGRHVVAGIGSATGRPER
jgi:hypothetical protein